MSDQVYGPKGKCDRQAAMQMARENRKRIEDAMKAEIDRDSDNAHPIAPAQWSTTPPREPGWYWTRYHAPDYEEAPIVRRVIKGELPYPRGVYREWWPVRISEPPR